MRGEVAGGSLPFVLAAGAAVVAFVLTRAFWDWNGEHYQWRRIWLETAYIALMPAVLALAGVWQKSRFTALLAAVSAALTMALRCGRLCVAAEL